MELLAVVITGLDLEGEEMFVSLFSFVRPLKKVLLWPGSNHWLFSSLLIFFCCSQRELCVIWFLSLRREVFLLVDFTHIRIFPCLFRSQSQLASLTFLMLFCVRQARHRVS